MLNNINTILSVAFKNETGNKLDTNYILMQYIDDDNTFLSFTELDKLGINPNSKYDTPLGIYCYPIKLSYDYYYKKKNRHNNKYFLYSLPFAIREKYFTIFKAEDLNRVITENYTKEQFEEDFKKLKRLYSFSFSYDEFIKKLDNASIPYEDVIYKPFAKLFYLTYLVANKDPIKWNKIFRELGYEGFIDPGYSIIHGNEPCQAIFFSIKNIEIINRFENIYNYKKFNVNEIKNIHNLLNTTIVDNEEKQKYYNCVLDIKSEKIISNYYKSCNINFSNDKTRIVESNFDSSKIKNAKDIYHCNIFNCSVKNVIITNFIQTKKTKYNESIFKTTDCDILNDCIFNNCSFESISLILDKNIKFSNCNFSKNTEIAILEDYDAIPVFKNCLFNNIDLKKIKNFEELKDTGLSICIGADYSKTFYNGPNFFDYEKIKKMKRDSNQFKILKKFYSIYLPNLLFLLD